MDTKSDMGTETFGEANDKVTRTVHSTTDDTDQVTIHLYFYMEQYVAVDVSNTHVIEKHGILHGPMVGEKQVHKAARFDYNPDWDYSKNYQYQWEFMWFPASVLDDSPKQVSWLELLVNTGFSRGKVAKILYSFDDPLSELGLIDNQ